MEWLTGIGVVLTAIGVPALISWYLTRRLANAQEIGQVLSNEEQARQEAARWYAAWLDSEEARRKDREQWESAEAAMRQELRDEMHAMWVAQQKRDQEWEHKCLSLSRRITGLEATLQANGLQIPNGH